MNPDPYLGRKMSAREALAPIRSGARVLVGSGAAEPQELTHALAARGTELCNIEVLHLLTLGTAPYAQAKYRDCFRHNALFIGPNVRDAVARGLADYTPCFLSEVPRLIRSGRIPVDVALIEVTPPEGGVCSLGVSVDIVKAAVEAAEYVVAQVNCAMPWTLGDSFIKVSDIDAFVVKEEPILELPRPEPTAAALWIGRYVARLIEDGDTIQAGIGAIPDAVLSALMDKKDLGIHSEMISDGVLALWRAGKITGARKSLHPGKIVAGFCLGSRALYEAVSRNPTFEFYPSDYVNAPSVIAKNERMVAINSALQVDLTGQVGADSLGHRFYSGVGGQVDFIRGAAASPGGRSIIALPSTAKKGSVSRIVPAMSEGTGVVTSRADIDFVVTEYGIASLKGKTIRERAVALIQVAHPKHRAELAKAAKAVGYLDEGHVLPVLEEPYRAELEAKRRFGEEEVFFRPIKPSDERYLKELFYTQSQETTYLRYGMALKRLSEKQFQEMVAIDYRNSMAIAAFARAGGRQRMIAVARYYVLPGSKSAEAAFTVHDDFQGLGIGRFLVHYLSWIAQERGLEAFEAEVLSVNGPMRRLFRESFRGARERILGPDGVLISVRLAERKGAGNPALAPDRVASMAVP
ncbi:MAG TPA: GNAT family N-acetyltransferase, partial [Elusimicrobiota bacterium]|nr:GNAT family N-acetyltransferase [Elusimicrobiota bacterium]